MSEVFEQYSPSDDRDLSRAHWQRTVGAVVMNQACKNLFSVNSIEFSEDMVSSVSSQAAKYAADCRIPLLWAEASVLSEQYIAFKLPQDILEPEPHYPVALYDQLEKYTYEGRLSEVIREGLQAQAYFPVNLARKIDTYARHAKFPSLYIDSLADLANLVERPDFRTMTDQALLTRNGIWQSFTATTNPSQTENAPSLFTRDLITIDDQEHIAFRPFVLRSLRQSLSQVNAVGVRPEKGTILSTVSSSGCPAGHSRPRFTDSPSDTDKLMVLREFYNVTDQELLADQPETIVQRGLTYYASVLRAADKALRN